MTRRYVVQEHTVEPGDVHYDLMIEDGDVLVTFQLDRSPDGSGAPLGTAGRRSFDHRSVYLDYEGPVSKGRGAVRIWDGGEVTDVLGAPRDPDYQGRFAGRRVSGLWQIASEGEGVRFSPIGVPHD